AGLTINFNGKKFHSERGLYDLLDRRTDDESMRYPIIHLRGDDIEMAITHNNMYGEEYYSFVNGQYTTQGGTHLAAFREAYVKTIREFYNKNFDATDVRASIVAAVKVRVVWTVSESHTRTRLCSQNVAPEGPTMNSFVNDIVKAQYDNYLHKIPSTAVALLTRIMQSVRGRKDMDGIKKLAN